MNSNTSHSQFQKNTAAADSESHSSPEPFPPSNCPDYSPTAFPNGIFLPSKAEPADTKLISYKFDNAYYEPLRKIDWNVFVTLKFRGKRYTGSSPSGAWRRERYLRELGHEVIGELNLSSNDLQYFWAEEINSDQEAHYHVLFHSVYSDKCSAEDLRGSIERNIDPKIVQIPRTVGSEEPPHVQTVQSQDRVVRYLLKIPIFQNEPKTVGHSHKFVRFWKRQNRWRMRSAA